MPAKLTDIEQRDQNALEDMAMKYYNKLSPAAQKKLLDDVSKFQDRLVDRANINPADGAKYMFAVIDALIASDPNYLSNVADIKCRKGCSHCCHLNLQVTELEMMVAYAYCMRKGIPIDIDYLKEQVKITDERERIKSNYSACVFLKNNECSIYPIRPVVCRKHFVVTDPALCNYKDNFDNITEVASVFCFTAEMYQGGVVNVTGEFDRLPVVLLHAIEKFEIAKENMKE